MKFCTTCDVGVHSLEDCPILLKKNINKKLVNNLSLVHKNDILNVKNLQIITRLGTKIANDKEKEKK